MVETHLIDGFTHIIPIIFRLLTASFKPRITTCFSVATENDAMTKTTTRGEWEELSLLDIARYTMNPWLLLSGWWFQYIFPLNYIYMGISSSDQICVQCRLCHM